MTGAKAQMPPVEGNNPLMLHNVPFRCAPTTRGDIKALNAGAEEILAETKVKDTPENRALHLLLT